MAQPSSKIAEAFCGGEEGHEGDAKLRGDSVNSVIAAALRLGEAATPIPLQPRLPGMAPGLGGFNIDPSPLRTGNVRDPVVLAPLPDDRWLRYYEPPCAKWWSGYAVPRFSGYSAPLVICAGVAIVVIAGLYLAGAQRQLDKLITITPFSSEALRDRKPDLPVEAQTRVANPPLSVGIVAPGASDGATRTIEGLPDGADLSLGGRSDHSSPLNNGTASAGSAAAPSTSSSSSPKPGLALPPLAPPDTVGQGSGTRAVTSKRDARLKHPRRKRTSAMEDAPTVFNLFSWEYLMGARPPPVQIQRSGKSPTRRTEGRRVKP
jgi:hypothetical protein